MNISLLILLAVVLVAVAVLIGFLLATVLGGKSAEPPPQARKEGLNRQISFYSDHQFRNIVIQIEGKTVASPHLLQENERRQLLLLDQTLRKWLNLQPASAEKLAQATPKPDSTTPEATPAQEPLLFSDIPGKAISPPSVEPPAKRGVADWLAQALQPKSSVSEPTRSIAMQVDEILQRKLQETGWSGRGIRLMELPNKGMVVLIGLDQYATVDDVPDAEIRALIRASVSEWETKMLGG
ncbi:MAG: hypothetical protein N3D16_11850 [Anaerolineales bacterium]|nr:hypothetical protein [Anaerolineales bacterium]